MKNNGGDVGDNTTEGNSKKNDKGLTATDSKLDNNNDDDDDDEKIILTMPRVIRNCISFLCVILITIGELMNEQNLWAVLLIGGSLGIMNVIVTSLGLEQIQAKANTNFGSMISGAEMGSSVRFSDNVVTPSVQEDRSRRNGLEEMIGMDEERSRTQRKRRNTTRSKRRKETGIPPDAISIEIERGEPDDEATVDSDSGLESFHEWRGRRDLDRRGKVREEGTKKRPRVVDRDKSRENRSKGVREKVILKGRKGNDAGEKTRKERVKDRDRDRDRRDRKDRSKKRKKKKKDRYEHAPCAYVQV